jgi:hypothetical protein
MHRHCEKLEEMCVCHYDLINDEKQHKELKSDENSSPPKD